MKRHRHRWHYIGSVFILAGKQWAVPVCRVCKISLKRHIPDYATGKTYCGRALKSSPVINIHIDCIEDAECKACQRSDDRRTREVARREEAQAS